MGKLKDLLDTSFCVFSIEVVAMFLSHQVTYCLLLCKAETLTTWPLFPQAETGHRHAGRARARPGPPAGPVPVDREWGRGRAEEEGAAGDEEWEEAGAEL